MNSFTTPTLYKRLVFFITVCSLLLCCTKGSDNFRSVIDLSGTWQFALDSAHLGVEQKWFLRDFSDSIELPGTTDLRHKGFRKNDTTTLHLNRVYTYEGPAWYKKTITIPENWQGRHIQLILERTKPSKIWIDDNYVGASYLLESPQHYIVSPFLTPGKHTLTIRIDNDLKLTPYGNVHIYSDETQTNWNGVIGAFRLEASDKTHLTDVQVFPDIVNKKIKVRLTINSEVDLDNIDVEFQVEKEFDNKKTKLETAHYTVPYDTIVEVEYALNDDTELWDEYRQPVYKLNAVISNNLFKDNMLVPFGMRKFATKGTNFTINDRITFLRGKHDACVFPLTGHPPMDTAGWMRVFKIAKAYGINHYRFHSWCPPEAAFAAADKVGIYLQPELPFWGHLEPDTLAARLQEEGIALLHSYANHPSFVMFSAGNEIWSGYDRVKKILDTLKQTDGRPLYTQGSNNGIGYVAPMLGNDYHTAARTPYAHDTILTHTRLTMAFADSKDGAILNTQLPSTLINFDYPVSQIKVPLISHETGQYQIYPDYREIDKYTGVLRAWNLEVFRKRLQRSGMFNQNQDFTKASGVLSALCYRAEIEAALRTKGFGGFQLLDLQDFPGQGTALVGILDAFMDSKNVITREEWTQFCNDAVPLLLFEKYCWTSDEAFSATVQVANYSSKNLKNNIQWKVVDENNTILKTGTFTSVDIPNEGLHAIGKIELPLSMIKVPQKLTITLSLDKTSYKNSYPIWVYSKPGAVKTDDDIIIATSMNSDLLNKLKMGKKVLLFPTASSIEKNSVAGLFPPDFWNYGMFKGISESGKQPVSPGTLGILTNPKHPIFINFPTDFYTNWQWWNIIKNSNSLILDVTEKKYRPIVQVIDNMERNHKLGLIFEMKVGKGKLLVCTSRLNTILKKPEAFQLYTSIITYMKSDQFKPDYMADEKLLRELIR